MAEEGNPDGEQMVFDLDQYLKESFENMLLVAKASAKMLKRPKDVEIAQQMILKCEAFHNQENIDIRSKNNIFFGYFLRVLNWTVDHQPIQHYNKWVWFTKYTLLIV